MKVQFTSVTDYRNNQSMNQSKSQNKQIHFGLLNNIVDRVYKKAPGRPYTEQELTKGLFDWLTLRFFFKAKEAGATLAEKKDCIEARKTFYKVEGKKTQEQINAAIADGKKYLGLED